MSCIIQLIAFGYQNYVYKTLQYCLNLVEIEMVLNNKIKELNKYQYEAYFDRNADEFKIQGIIIDIDKENEYHNSIEYELHKITLEIYSYEMDEKFNKFEDKINLIGIVPLVLGKITYESNYIIINLPNIFFASETIFFNGIICYKFVIKTPIQFKKIYLEKIFRYNDHIERIKNGILSNVFYELDYKYVYIYPNVSKILNNIKTNEIMCEKKILNSKENLLGLYFAIPVQLVEFLNQIEFKNHIMNLDELKTCVEEKDFVNLYYVSFNTSFYLEKSDFIRFKFVNNNNNNVNNVNNINNEDLNIIKLIDNIYIYPIISNKLVCVNYNTKLKYLNGELNNTFNNDEKEIITKYTNNIDYLAENVFEYIKKYHQNKFNTKVDIESLDDCKKYILCKIN